MTEVDTNGTVDPRDIEKRVDRQLKQVVVVALITLAAVVLASTVVWIVVLSKVDRLSNAGADRFQQHRIRNEISHDCLHHDVDVNHTEIVNLRKDIADLVNGVTKPGQFPATSTEHLQACPPPSFVVPPAAH